VKGKTVSARRENLDVVALVAFEKVREMLEQDHQVMVFVYSRRDMLATAKVLYEKAVEAACVDLFDPMGHPKYESAVRDVKSTKAREIRDLVPNGLGIHHGHGTVG
jgi:antiviral helicase SLH1